MENLAAEVKGETAHYTCTEVDTLNHGYRHRGGYQHPFFPILRAAPRIGRGRGWIAWQLFFCLSMAVMLIMPWQKADFDAYHRAAVKVRLW